VSAVSVVFGLPAHPLLVYLTVVAIPLAALLIVVVAVFPRVPRLVKVTALVLGALSVVLVPLMESSGKALQERVAATPAVKRHAELGETLLPWVVGLVIVIIGVLAAQRWLRPAVSADPGSQSAAGRLALSAGLVTVGISVVAVVVAAGTLVQTIRIGLSGAQATWSTPGTSTPAPARLGPAREDEHVTR
jgi:hypothetical protein